MAAAAPSNNNNNNGSTPISSSDLHEAILANSQSVVELLLEKGADPNRSPQLAPVGVIAASPSERARDLHRTLGRVFRSRQGGTLYPLHVAVCNAYHHAVFGREEALGIVSALLKAGANASLTCHGIAFCKVGTHPSVTIASSKTADKVALFLKRFPPPHHATECCSMMDQVATLILSSCTTPSNDGNSENEDDSVGATALATWTNMLNDDSYADICFVCPDGQVLAHKSVLAAAVPYFDAAFQGPWKENAEDGINEWKTTNSVATMQYVLRFIYTGKVPNPSDGDEEDCGVDTATILSVASEYQLAPLQQQCQEQLISGLNENTIEQAMELAQLHSLTDLKEACHDYVHAYATTLLVQPSFMKLASTHPNVWQELVDGLARRDRKRKRSLDDDSSLHEDDQTRNNIAGGDRDE